MLSDSPPERDLQWTDTGISSSFKFINKIYDFVNKLENYNSNKVDDIGVLEDLKNIINEVSENIEAFQFNKSVAKIYEFVNILNDSILNKKLSKNNFLWSLEKLCIILQPFVPHISEEMWFKIGNKGLCVNEAWPTESVKKKNKSKIAIQINGKTREVIEIDSSLTKDGVLEIIKNNNKIKKSLVGKNIQREIYVPGKILNLVI